MKAADMQLLCGLWGEADPHLQRPWPSVTAVAAAASAAAVPTWTMASSPLPHLFVIYSLPIGMWAVAKVTDLNVMFWGISSFNRLCKP